MTNIDDNLKKIGKRTPYTMPDDLFGRMREQVMRRMDEIGKERQTQKHHRTLIARLAVAATSIAASACLVFMLRLGNVNSGENSGDGTPQASNSTSVDKAYDNLSQQERENLLADYKNDIYMSLQ